MEKFCVIVFILGTISGHLEASESMTCCPPSQYILSDTCFEPKNGTIGPMRLFCVQTIKKKEFSVGVGNINIAISKGKTISVNPNVACYGNITKDRNLTIVKSVALLCVTKEETEEIVKDTTLGYCMIVSVVFLALTAIVFTSLRELRDLYGKSIINFCISLAIGLGILSIMKLMKYNDMVSCAMRGFLAYFFLLTAFFWTNSIAVQVLRDTRRPYSVDYGWNEFRWYVLYSWGTPAILTICMAIVNWHPGDHQRPGIGLNHCWFFSKTQQWYYMYSVMSILLLVNIGIFIFMSTIVWRQTFKSTHIKAIKYKLLMTVRLIVLMGLPWIFEMVSSLAGGGHIVWAIADVFNSLQGILVFFVLVVSRKRVIKLMHKRGWLDCCSGVVERWLAVGDDAEENVIQHTDVPMQDEPQRTKAHQQNP